MVSGPLDCMGTIFLFAKLIGEGVWCRANPGSSL